MQLFLHFFLNLLCLFISVLRSPKLQLIKDFDESIVLIAQLPFLAQIETFILASTTPKYGDVQNHAADILIKQTLGLKNIQFWSWEDLEKYLDQYESLRDKYYPHLSKKKSGNIINQTTGDNGQNIYIQGNVNTLNL